MKLLSKLVLGMAVCFYLPLSFAEATPMSPLRYPKPLPIDEVKRFSHALEAVRALYVDEVSDSKLLENAIAGMLEGLDPHSSYLNERDYKALTISTEGEFSGLGIEVIREHDVIRVISPIDDTPAYRSGIKAGDLIVRIDGKPIKGMTLNEAVNQMRGLKGTSIELTIIRKGETKPLIKNVVRDTIVIESVKSWLIDGEYGYIRVGSFQVKTGEKVEQAIQHLKQESTHPLKGVVLDLRNNPGGVLQAAVDVASVFLEADQLGYDKKVVYTKGRLPEVNFTGLASGHDQLGHLPIVVLINMGSASAAEIVAGALQDHHRALIIGTRSFGKGSVQTVLPLEDEKTALKLTTARYYTPSGKAIQAKGVTPDVVVDEISIPTTVKAEETFFISEAELDNSLVAEDDHAASTETVKEVKSLVAKQNSTHAQSSESKDNKKSEEDHPEDMALLNEFSGVTNGKHWDNSKELFYQDYQLYEAIILLKGLASPLKVGA